MQVSANPFTAPADAGDNAPGPWFQAAYDSGECSRCGLDIWEGDTIRADGRGEYECCDDD